MCVPKFFQISFLFPISGLVFSRPMKLHMSHSQVNGTNAVHNAEFHFCCDVIFGISLAKGVFSKVETSGLKNNSLLGT